MHDVIKTKLNPDVNQPSTVRLRKPEGSKAIQDETDTDSALGGAYECFDNPASQHARLNQVHLQQNVRLRVIDRLDHPFEVLLGGFEQIEPIPFAPRPVGNGRIACGFRRWHGVTMTEGGA